LKTISFNISAIEVRQFSHGGSRGEVLEFLTCGRG